MLNICGQLFLLCPFGCSAPLHFEHLCSGHAKLPAFRWSELPHALHRGLGHCASMWPCSRQRSHTSSLGRSCCICASSVNEWRTLTVLDGHSRAEWPVAPHVLHTRYGHVPLFWRCPDCAHSVQKFGQSFWMVRCESDPQSTTYGLYDAIIVTMRFPGFPLGLRSGLAWTSASGLLLCPLGSITPLHFVHL